MYVYPDDKTVLRKMKQAQETQQCFTILDSDNCFHHCSEPYYGSESKALNNKAYSTQLHPKVFSNALNHLQNVGYVKRIGMSPFYQVTYDGWNVFNVQKHEMSVMIVTHFLFPAAVAFITTIITMILTNR